MQNPPDEAAEPMRDRANGLGMAEARDETAIRQLEDTTSVLTAAFAACTNIYG